MTSSEDAEASSGERPRAIVAGHAGFADGLVSAVQQIAGAGHVYVALSNKGLSGEDIEAMFKREAEKNQIRVFFTDLPGGSATLAVRRMMRLDDSIMLVTGTNLPALLEFAFCGDEEIAVAARRAAEKGCTALCTHGGS